MTLVERITDYLSKGGLFNPEHMEHDKVRTLLLDCREALIDSGNQAPSAGRSDPTALTDQQRSAMNETTVIPSKDS